MAVRNFDGTDDYIILNETGAFSGIDGTEASTVAALWKADTIKAQALWWQLNQPQSINPYSSGFVWYSAGNSAIQTHAYSANTWYLSLWTKAAGTAGIEVRSHVYNFTTQTWAHTNHGTISPAAQTGVTVSHIGRWAGSPEYLDGQIAALGLWVDTMPWATDASGDAAIEAAGLEAAYQNWVDASPDILYRLDQDPVAPIINEIGTGPDETSITGTNAVTGDDPPGFSFTGGGPVAHVPLTEAGALNVLAGTDGLSEVGAANVLAGTSRLTLAGALNAYAGTTGLSEAGAANAAAGTDGLSLAGALNVLVDALP